MSNSIGHNPLAVANHFIENRNPIDKQGIDLLKLIKLCYFAHGFTLALTDNILINEYAEAWRFGPVFPSVFHEFKGQSKITHPAERFNLEKNQIEKWTSDFSEKEKEILKNTNEKLSPLSGIDLSELTHKKDSPWDKAWEEGKRIRGFSISNEAIKADFKNNLR